MKLMNKVHTCKQSIFLQLEVTEKHSDEHRNTLVIETSLPSKPDWQFKTFHILQ